MADYGEFKVGAVSYPVPASPVLPAKTVLDPALATALDYFKAVLNLHLGAYWDALVAQIGLSGLAGKLVAEAVTYDPALYLQEAQYRFPLLALYRVRGDIRDKTVAWYRLKTEWRLIFALPTLTAAQMLSMSPLLWSVLRVINDRTQQGYDPSYQNGALVFGDGGIASIAPDSYQFGHLVNPRTDLVFPTLEMSFQVEEREQLNPGLLPLGGIDTTLSVSQGTPDDEVTVVEVSQDFTP
ncbi:hypothetical protein [Polyangium spumosum]|uniref:Uncharacterized protein n=1 Tax=Polyangium spumosum TaxID=889282 RepID=A0A6N7Q1Q7_9BACT|nr:hypothetical protein [Polyangium spumosum]MRG98213.1 hypothetical protein [Polyangium spumosum]